MCNNVNVSSESRTKLHSFVGSPLKGSKNHEEDDQGNSDNKSEYCNDQQAKSEPAVSFFFIFITPIVLPARQSGPKSPRDTLRERSVESGPEQCSRG